MRMWMVNPVTICTQHLLGEHFEFHKHLSRWHIRKQSITGYIASNAIEPLSYKARHDLIAAEMKRRSFNHYSVMIQPDFTYLSEEELNAKVNIAKSIEFLHSECQECKSKWWSWFEGLCLNERVMIDSYLFKQRR